MGAHLAEAVAKYLQEARSGGITTNGNQPAFHRPTNSTGTLLLALANTNLQELCGWPVDSLVATVGLEN